MGFVFKKIAKANKAKAPIVNSREYVCMVIYVIIVTYKVYFMKAFVINLKKDQDRRAFMEKQLNDLEIEHEFIEAYYAKEKIEAEISKIYDSSKSKNINGNDLSLPEIGCAYSHTLVYQKIVDQNLSYALILEDDVKIDKRLLKVIDLVKNKHEENDKSDFDWLQIDYIQPGIFFWKHWCSLSIKEIKNNPSSIFYILLKFIYVSVLSVYEGIRNTFYNFSKILVIVSFYRPLYLASAYIVTSDGAAKLLKINTPVILTADRLPNFVRPSFVMKAISPLITEQQREIFASNIENINLNNHE